MSRPRQPVPESANGTLYRSALRSLAQYMDSGLFLTGDVMFPGLALRVARLAQEEARREEDGGDEAYGDPVAV